MPLFEHMPYTNFENINLDWILKTIKTHQTDIDGLKSDVDGIKTTIINIQGDITTIQQQIGDIDVVELRRRLDALEADARSIHTSLTALTGRVTTTENNVATNTSDIAENASDIEANDTSSRQRDDALSARIENLERATIHDIYNYYGSKNLILFGSDLSNLPASCKDSDGYPFEWGNKYNQRFSVGTETARAWKFINLGLVPDTNQSAYDYYQCGFFDLSLASVISALHLTLTIGTSTSASMRILQQHTFTTINEEWEIAEGCKVKFAMDTSIQTNIRYTIWLMGTPQSWMSFLGGPIQFMYLEFGDGSIEASGQPEARYILPFDIKDQQFFGHDATPTIDVEPIEGNASATATVTYYDQVGEPQTLEAGVDIVVSASKYGKVVDGYLQMRINLENNLGDKLARGAQFTLANVAMSYLSDKALPMPRGTSTLIGVATDSRSLAWDYVNTQNTYIWFNIDTGAGNIGTFNVKLISSGMRNYTSGSATGNTMFKIPFHYIAS